MEKNRLLITVCAAALATGLGVGTASAQDGSNWQGFYGGVHTGFGEADLDISYIASASSSAANAVSNLDGALVGLHVGYNWDLDGSLVVGLEGDVDWLIFDWDENNFAASTDGFRGEASYLASLRGRLGQEVGSDALIYVTGGVAFTDVDTVLHYGSSGNQEPVDGWDYGGVVGAGVEHKIAPNLAVRAEGLYYFFGEEDWVCHTSCTDGRTVGDIDLNAYTFRIGITWQFGG